MYEFSRSTVFLEGEKSDTFSLEQGVVQDCSLSPILFSVFINDLLIEVEKAGLGVQLNNGKSIGFPLAHCLVMMAWYDTA